MINSETGPILNTSALAFLSDSLKITTSSARFGIIKKDEHYERTKSFYECLLRLRERTKNDFESEVFNEFMAGIKYIDVQTRLFYYCGKKDYDYSKLIEELIKTNQGILEGKIVGEIEKFEDIANFLEREFYKVSGI